MVRALSTDRQDLVKSMNSAVQGGFVTIGEARSSLGLENDDSHNVYLRPLNMVAVAEGETGIIVPEAKDDEKASLNTTRFQPEVRRSRIKKKPKKKSRFQQRMDDIAKQQQKKRG